MPRQFFTLLALTILMVGFAYVFRPDTRAAGLRHNRDLILKPLYSKSIAAGSSDEIGKTAPHQNSLTLGLKQQTSPRVLMTSTENSADLAKTYSGHESDGSLVKFSGTSMPSAILSFDGLSNFDNLNAFGAFFLPPDAVGDVGPNNYVQAVNALIRVYDKRGNALNQSFKFSQIFSPLGTACSTRNDGEATVQYDPLADRWLLSQYCNNFPPFRQMIAVSKTGDPTGSYYIYEFVMPSTRLNDFAKFGVWPDGYYMSTEEFFGSDYVGSGVFAFDRSKMLVGDPSAGFIYFSLPATSVDRRGGFLPADLDGLTPPRVGAPNTFASYSATEYGDAEDAVRLFDFHADFVTPEISTFAERPESPLTVAAFDPTSSSGRADILEPAPGQPVDSNSDRLMSRVAYRNFGSYESLVLNQTVRTSRQTDPYRAGVRVYRLRRTGSVYAIEEQSTIGDANSSRWIGSAAEDGDGNLAVGYNTVSDEKMPSVAYSGKLATDPSGVFRSESKLVNGTGVQTAFGFRWGDWSSMSVDPVDDCTFWMTGEYFTAESQAFSDFTWLTRIGNFAFPECTPKQRGRLTLRVLSDATGEPIQNATVRVALPGMAPYFRQTQDDGDTETILLSPDTYVIAVATDGYRSEILQASVGLEKGLPVVVRLRPVPVIENSTISFVAESCAIDQAAEPGETATVNAAFRNVGRTNTRNLRIALESENHVVTTDPPRNIGIMRPNGGEVSRPFTFTVSPDTHCGEPLSLTFRVTDGRERLDDIHVERPSGTPRIAMSENFDTSGPALPSGWSTSSSGAQQTWATSTTRFQSPLNSGFSPDPNQIGINELVSPVFSISTGEALLSFRNFYDFEATFLRNRLFDGGVLEIKIGTDDWRDIVAAGGEFESGGYDGLLDNCCQNPLAGRMGWSGTSGPNRPADFVTTRVKLPAGAAGHNVQLRWRVGTDTGTFKEGQYIDDVLVTDGSSCGCTLGNR